ncbi:MAG: hypothetical protein WBP72_07905 [Rhodocyclaceae bacterium]
MKTPKMLPWLAHKAGLSAARAEALWAEAVLHASLAARGLDPVEHNNVAVARLLELLEAEKEAVRVVPMQSEPAQVAHKAAPTRGRWPYSLIVAMKPKSEDSVPSPSPAS